MECGSPVPAFELDDTAKASILPCRFRAEYRRPARLSIICANPCGDYLLELEINAYSTDELQHFGGFLQTVSINAANL
jgi:hypothetical protein